MTETLCITKMCLKIRFYKSNFKILQLIWLTKFQANDIACLIASSTKFASLYLSIYLSFRIIILGILRNWLQIIWQCHQNSNVSIWYFTIATIYAKQYMMYISTHKRGNLNHRRKTNTEPNLIYTTGSICMQTLMVRIFPCWFQCIYVCYIWSIHLEVFICI